MAATAPSTCALTLCLLGPFEAQVHGAPLPSLRTRKDAWLLALLALHASRPLDRAWLAGTLWPDSSEATALSNLRQSLKSLRRALGPQADRLLTPTPRSLALDLAGAKVDLLVFDAAVARGDSTSLEEAVGIYRGPLLDGCGEAWVLPERRVREEAYLAALERLAALASERHDWVTAESYLRRVTLTDPLRESAQRGLMAALAAGGSHAAAVQVYRDLRVRLHRELNASPDPETHAIYDRIRQHAMGLQGKAKDSSRKCETSENANQSVTGGQPGAVPHNLPHPLTRFIGREREVAAVRELLAERRLVTLTGVGGSGKTRLAIETARGLVGVGPAADYRPMGGVWLVELASLSDPDRVVERVAAALCIAEQPDRPRVETLTELLRDRELLVVMDNCEHLIEACAYLAEALLTACPGLRVLATSRESLGITGEQTFPVPPLSLPERAELRQGNVSFLSTLRRSEAALLFVDRAGLADPAFALTETNASAVREICYRLDGIPLAIELAAARIRTDPVAGIAAGLADRFALLTGGSRTALPRHRTLHAMIEWSHELLSEAEQVLFRRLSVFAGGCTPDAAVAVCGDEAADLLSRLVGKSLLQREERQDEARFWMLETIREYAWERLKAAGEAETLCHRHGAFFLALAEEADAHDTRPDSGKWLDRLEREHDNLRLALRRWMEKAQSGHEAHTTAESALRIAGAMRGFWGTRGHWQEGRQRLEEALALPSATARTAARAEAMAGLSWFTEALASDYETALNLCVESLAIRRELGDRRAIAVTLRRLVHCLVLLDRFDEAIPHLQEAQAIWEELGDRTGTAEVAEVLGGIAYRQLDFARAREFYEEALTIWREQDDREAVATRLQNIAMAAYLQGDYESAEAAAGECAAVCREIGDRRNLMYVLPWLGQAAAVRGDTGTACSCYDEALELTREFDNEGGVAFLLRLRGDVARREGALAMAAADYEESLTLARKQDQRPMIALAMLGLAEVALGHGDLGRARSLFCEGLRLSAVGYERLSLFDRGGPAAVLAACLGGMAAIALAEGEAERSARLLGAASAVRRTGVAPLRPFDRAEHDRRVADARDTLGGATFAAAWKEGEALSLEAAIKLALQET